MQYAGIGLFLIMLLSVSSAFSDEAWALESADSGVQVSLTSDSDSYVAGDTAMFDLLVHNTGSGCVGSVAYEFSLPTGMTIAEASRISGSLGDMQSGEQYHAVIKVEIGKNAASSVDLPSSDNRLAGTGDSWLVGPVALFVVVAAVIALLASKRSRNATLSVILVCGLSGVLAVGSQEKANAADSREVVTSTHIVSVDGKDSAVSATVSFASSSITPDAPDQLITRAQWLEMLLKAANTDVQSDLECPYADVLGHEFENVIATVYALGAIPNELTEFKPDAPATREFAFATAVLLCGFVEDGSVLNAVDAADCEHASLLAVALDAGFASLDDSGCINPMNNLDKAMASDIANRVAEFLVQRNLGTEGVDVEYQDDVVVVKDYFVGELGFVVESSRYSLKEGDKVVFVPTDENPQGSAGLVIEAVHNEMEQTTIEYEQATTPSEIFKSISICESGLMPDLSDVEFADGVEVLNDAARAALSRESISLGKMKLKVPIADGVKCDVEFAPTFDINWKWSWASGLERCQLGIGNEATIGLSLEGFEEKPLEKTIPINKKPIKIPLSHGAYVYFNLNLEISVSGEASLNVTMAQSQGVRYEKGHFSMYKEGSFETEANVEASAKAGVAPAAILCLLSVELCDLQLGVGGKAKGETTLRDTGMKCNNVSLYVYGGLSAGHNTFWMNAIGLTYDFPEFWNEDHSPFSWKAHFEDGEKVLECTYEKGGPVDPDIPDVPDVPDEPDYSEPDVPEIVDNGYGEEPSFGDRGMIMGPILVEPFNVNAGNAITLGEIGAPAPVLSFWLIGGWECTPGTVFLMKYYDSNGDLQSEEVKTSADGWTMTGTRYPNEPLTVEVLYGRVTITEISGFSPIPYSRDVVPVVDYPMQISAVRLNMVVGSTDQLLLSMHENMQGHEWAGSVAWESSDPSIAIVDEFGAVEAISPGTATIVARWGSLYERKCLVSVS